MTTMTLLNGMSIFKQKLMRSSKRLSSAFTVIELLVVVAIIAILFIILILFLPKQIARSRDAQRKTDLERIKVAFEDYYNDKGCYPPADVLEDCDGVEFAPYLASIPCDPVSEEPYFYVPLSSNACKGYRVYTGLEVEDDPAIEELGCDGVNGCGYGSDYNYGVSAGIEVYDADASPLPTPTSTPSGSSTPAPVIYVYACDSSGVCNQFEEGHPDLQTCPITFPQTNCDNQCGNVANRCTGF